MRNHVFVKPNRDPWRVDYPKTPIGGQNPYWQCSSCGRSDPEINGSLYKHAPSCEWAKNQIAKL